MPSISMWINTCKKKAWRLHSIATVDHNKRQGACRANDIILSHWNHTSKELHIWLNSANQNHTLQA